MSLGSNLQYLRKMNRSMTQEDLAEILNVSRQTVAKWEADSAYPEIDKLIKLSDYFSCSLDELLRHDLNSSNKAYSPVRIEDVEAFKMVRYAVVSHEPEDDARAHIEKWAKDNGLFDRDDYTPTIIGWDFPYVSQNQINVFHMHGYASACIVPDDFVSNSPEIEVITQQKQKYAVITITNPFRAPFELIPNAYKTLMSYMRVNRIPHKEADNVIPCFEKVYEKDSVEYMDVYIAADI